MTKEEIISHALQSVSVIQGMQASWEYATPNEVDGCLNLVINTNVYVLNALVKKEIRIQTLDKLIHFNEIYSPFIVVAARISPKIKIQLQQNNIAYLEANGNIYLNNNSNFILIDSNRPLQLEEKFKSRVYTKTGLKVVFEFLNNKDLIHLPYRQIALNTNTAVGNVANILKGLKEEGFVLQLTNHEISFKNKNKLLEKWINAYENNLKSSLKVGNFTFIDETRFYNWKSLPLTERLTFWGGEPAADILTNHLRPEKLTLYTTETRNELMKNYRLVPDLNGKVEVYKRFWSESSFLNNHKNCAPALVVYADLTTSDDKRNRETAKLIYEQYIEQNL
jgi:hypothetical protein